MSELDLSKPVQVNVKGEWKNAERVKPHTYEVTYHDEYDDSLNHVYVNSDRLRNTPAPAPAPVEEGWRYFKQKSYDNYWRTNGVRNEIRFRGKWIDEPPTNYLWTAERFLSAGWLETDAHGNPLAKTPPPTRQRSHLARVIERLVQEVGGTISPQAFTDIDLNAAMDEADRHAASREVTE